MLRFDDGDMDTRADIIIQLWQECHVAPADAPVPWDVSESVALGMKLYDVMLGVGQSYEIRDRINQSASQLFYAAVRRQINLDGLNERNKTRLCAMTLSGIKIARRADDLTELTDLHQRIVHFVSIPPALASISCICQPMDRQILDIATLLLTMDKKDIFFSSTLLYNENEALDPFNLGSFLKGETDLFKNNAKEKLKRLIPGQKLLFPILSTSIHNSTKRATDGHFSAILAIKTTQGYRFTLFDSNSTPGTHDNKSQLIRCLIEPGEEVEITTLRQPFQYHNDCGLHTYNFFKLCITAHPAAFEEPKLMREQFENYIIQLEVRNLGLHEGRRTTSFLLRLLFALDCMLNGYIDGLENREDMHKLLYQPLAVSVPVVFERNNTRSFPTLWNNLRTRLGNVFFLRPDSPSRKGNTVPPVAYSALQKAGREKDLEQEHEPA